MFVQTRHVRRGESRLLPRPFCLRSGHEPRLLIPAIQGAGGASTRAAERQRADEPERAAENRPSSRGNSHYRSIGRPAAALAGERASRRWW
jgi:hypothetical protein